MRVNLPEPDHLFLLVQYCLQNEELVSNFNRLTGSSIGKNLAPISRAIDDATGKTEADLTQFIGFVKDCFWDRLPQECFEVQP